MKVCQMMTGQGGWPLTVLMTPDQIPFYAGTYFPKESKYGRPGLIELLTGLHKKYVDDPEHIEDVTNSVTNALMQAVETKSNNRLTKKAIDEAFQQLVKKFDMDYGGFSPAPKFPQPQNILFLLNYHFFTGNQNALQMAEKTLQSMANGGIFDQVGFGFSRYSTDEEWLVPHFEKMLHDNALLLIAYTECYQVTKNPFYKRVSEQIIEFVMREMTSTDGAFYSAIDADSEGVEGKYYVWEYEEIFEILGKELGELYTTVYNITPHGNFEGKNIPNKIGRDLSQIAQENNLSTDELEQKLEVARKQLLEKREQRIYPHVDDKILTSWNSMMITALAIAGKVYSENKYTNAAEKAVEFIENHLFDEERLMARYRDGETKFKAYLDDYVFLIWAYLELYETTASLNYLQKGKKRLDDMLDLFWDEQHGGFYQTGTDAEYLISREKDIYDGALPSGNGLAAIMLVKMAFLTGEIAYLDKAEEMKHTFYDSLSNYASASTTFMQSLMLMENPTKEVVIIGEEKDKDRQMLMKKLHSTCLPNAFILVGENSKNLSAVAPFTAEYKQLEGKTTIYVCENFACQNPTTDVEDAVRKIVEGKSS